MVEVQIQGTCLVGTVAIGVGWGRTRRTDPGRVARHLLAVATLLAVAYGTRHEDARARGRPPGQLRRPPTDAPSKSVTPRRFSLLRQGAGGLRCLSPSVA